MALLCVQGTHGSIVNWWNGRPGDKMVVNEKGNKEQGTVKTEKKKKGWDWKDWNWEYDQYDY